MNLVYKWGLLLTVGCCLGAQSLDDPVMKARLQRSQAQGIEESDLPPVPRGVTEPPPLPPPEIHAKDSPHARAAKPTRRRGGKVRAGKQAKVESHAEPLGPARAAKSARQPRLAGKAARPAGKVARRPARRGKV
jgi:hypothetical protein